MRARTIAILLIMLAAAGAAYADYTADLVIQSGTTTQTAKVFAKANRSRMEFPGNSAVIITRQDKGITWFLSPKNKTYREMKGTQFGRKSAFYRAIPGVKYLGTEKVNGYVCNKYIISRQGKMPSTTTMWVSDELGAEVRAVTKVGKNVQSVDLKNIKKRFLWRVSFDIPKGYKKVG